MKNLSALHRDLTALDGKPYGVYRDLAGTRYDLGGGVVFTLDRAQVDPYAPPSLATLSVPLALPEYRERGQRVAAADFFTRVFDAAVSGDRDLSIGRVGQQILERTTAEVRDDHLLVRFTVALPAAGRRIKGRLASTILTKRLPEAARRLHGADRAELDRHVTLHQDQEWLRARLPELGLVAFVGEGSLLPRRAGDSDEPLRGAVPFASPESLRREVTLPSGRTLTGMGVPEGVTVIVGGGYHGKSTLLRALISADREPITPFVDTVRSLYRDAGVSTILVAGGSGAFFPVADHVIALDAYRVSDVTDRAHDLGGEAPSASAEFRPGAPRVPVELSAPGKRKPAAAKGRTLIRYGKATIDLGPAEQLVDQAQTTGIAHAIDLLEGRLGSGESLRAAVEQVTELIDAQGLGALSPHRGHPGLYARPRAYEIMAAVNRYRGLEVS